MEVLLPIQVGAQFKAWACICSLAGIVGLNPDGGIDVCPLLSGRGLCVGLIAHPEESYRVWVHLSVIVKPQGQGGPGPLGTIKPQKQNWRC